MPSVSSPSSGTYNYIATPPSIDERLKPSLVRGEIEHVDVDVDQLLTGPLSEVNRARIEALRRSGMLAERARFVTCYRSAEGPVVELRTGYCEPGLISSSRLLSFPRIRDLFDGTALTGDLNLKSDALGNSVFIRADDPVASVEWTALVRFLESKGVIVAGVTEQNPFGDAVAEVGCFSDDTIELTGFKTQDRILSAVRLTAFGRSINSSSPKPPRHNLPGLNRIDTHAMAIAICKDGVWSPTTILPSGGINFTSANTTALQYSQQGFEGAVAVYDGDASISLFRIDANAERLQETARAIGVAPVPVDQIVEAVRVVVELNRDYVPLDGGKLYIRPCLLGLESNGANSAKTAMLVVEAFPYGDYLGKDSPGISVVTLLDKSRPPSGAAKLGANYGVDFQLKTEVKKAGFGDFMSIDLNGNVQELSTAALVFVQNNGQRNYSLCSPYVAGERPAGERVDVLNSITRRSVLELAKVFGVEVEKRDIHHSELGNFASLFSTGTAMGITRVNSLDVRPSFTHETMKRIDYSSDQTAISLVGEFSELIAAARQGQLRSTVERWLKDESDSSEYLHVKVVGMQSDAREGLLRALEALDARWAVKIPLGRDHL